MLTFGKVTAAWLIAVDRLECLRRDLFIHGLIDAVNVTVSSMLMVSSKVAILSILEAASIWSAFIFRRGL